MQSMLSAIFEDDIGESEPVGDPPPLPSSSVYAGLDPEHAALYEQLIEKAAWSRDEMEAQCNALGLMIDGAIETLMTGRLIRSMRRSLTRMAIYSSMLTSSMRSPKTGTGIGL